MTTNEEIKAAALHLFAYRGYEGTSTNDIAKAVGLKKQSLYSHFESKIELYLEVQRDQSKLINETLLHRFEELKEAPTEAMLRGLFDCIVEIFSHKERLLLWNRSFVEHNKDNPGMPNHSDWEYGTKFRTQLYDVLGQRHPDINDPHRFRSIFLSYMLTIQGYLSWMGIMGHDERVFEDIWKNFWYGFDHCLENRN